MDCCKVLLISKSEADFQQVKEMLSRARRGNFEVSYAPDRNAAASRLPVDVILLALNGDANSLLPDTPADLPPVILLSPDDGTEANLDGRACVIENLAREDLNPALLAYTIRRAARNSAAWECMETVLDQRVEARTRNLSRMLLDTLESITDAFLVVDHEWTITYINARAAQQSRLTSKECAGNNLWEAMPGLADTLVTERARVVMETRQPAHFEFKDPDQPTWYDMSIYPNDGGISIFWRDKTDQKRAEMETERLVVALQDAHRAAERSAADARQTAREIRATSTRLEAILNSLNTAVIVYDMEGYIEQANAFAIAMLGFDPMHMPRATLLRKVKFLTKDGQSVNLKDVPYRKAAKGETIFNVPMVLVNQRGRTYSLLISALPLYIGRESIGVVTIWNDVTNRERMQMEIRQKDEIMERQKELLAKIFEDSPVGIAVLEGPDHRFRLYNPAYQAVVNGSSEIIGRPFQQVFPNRTETLALLERVFATGEPFEGVNIPVRFSEDENQPTRYFTQIYTPLFNPDGKVESILSISLETTEQLTMASLIETTRARLADEQQRHRIQVEVHHQLLEHSEMERTQIARDLHEGPLQDLIALDFGLVEAIGMSAKTERLRKMRWIQEGLQHEIRALRAYCNELRPPVLAPFGLEKAIRSHIDSLRLLHSEVTIHARLTPDGKRLDESTRMTLFRIYQSMIGNVYRHAKATEIWVDLLVDEHELSLSVQDNGVGFIMPEDWVGIAKEGRFGLVSARERIESIGGSIGIDSQPGGGTKVVIHLPL